MSFNNEIKEEGGISMAEKQDKTENINDGIDILLEEKVSENFNAIMNEIFDKLDTMNYDELKSWYEENLLLPSYTTEIDGNMISVQSHFNSQANETILEKIVRLLGIKIEYI